MIRISVQALNKERARDYCVLGVLGEAKTGAWCRKMMLFSSIRLTIRKIRVNFLHQNEKPLIDFIMAHTQSAKKRIRQTIARTAVNRAVLSRVRTLRKKVAAAVEAKDKDAASAAYNAFASAIDKAAKKGTVHANRAANYKSKAAKALATIA